MILFIRLAFAVGVSLYSALRRRVTGTPSGRHAGLPYWTRLERARDGAVLGVEYGFSMATRTPFALHSESSADLYAKMFGISMEIQTDDPAFDDAIYISGDHPEIARFFRERTEVRSALTDAFGAKVEWIEADGEMYWMSVRANREPTTEDVAEAFAIRRLFTLLESSGSEPIRDSFSGKAVLVRALLWFFAAYAVGGLIEYLFGISPDHLYPASVFGWGLLASTFIFVLLLFAIGPLFRRSSRGHRVLTESTLAFWIGFVGLGPTLVSDLNRELDSAPASMIEAKVVGKKKFRAGKTDQYLLIVRPYSDPGFALPTEVPVYQATYERYRLGDPVSFVIGPGALGLRWYRKVMLYD